MHDLEEQAVGEENRSCNDFLSTCQVILYSSPSLLKGALAASYHILLGQTPLLPPLVLPQRASPMEEQPTAAVSPTLVPKQSPRPKRWHPMPDPMESLPIGGASPKATLGGPPNPKRWEIPPWFKTLKPNHAEVFSWDYDMVKEARKEYFSKHSYDFTLDGNCNLSGMFKHLATSAGLLGTSIYKTQSPWTGPEELKQANYILLSLPEGLKFLWAVPLTISSGHGTDGYTWPRCPLLVWWCDLLPLVWKGGSKWRDSGQPPTDYTLQARPGVW